MEYLICADIFETLGLGWEKMLLYLANFAILFVGLTFLLFKPVKKFMAKRQEEIKNEYDAVENSKKEAEELKVKYEQEANLAIAEAKAKAERVQKDAEATLLRGNEIVEEAKKEADRIIREADSQAKEEKNQMLKEARDEVIDMAVGIAESILGREISKEDNEKISELEIAKTNFLDSIISRKGAFNNGGNNPKKE